MPTTTRKLGEQERLLNYLHAFGGLISLQVLSIRGPLTPELVQGGLDWLQQHHAILRAHVRLGGLVFRSLPPFAYRQPWFDTQGTTKIPLRIVDDAAPDARDKVMEWELKRPIRGRRKPRLRATLVRASASAEVQHLVIAADHAILDAQSWTMASREFLEFLRDPEAARAKPVLDAGLPEPLEAGLPKKPNAGANYQPAIRLPKRPVPGAHRGTAIVRRRLDASQMSALRTEMKSHRATLHGVVSGAVLGALHEKYGISEITCLSTIDLRRLAKPAFPPGTFGCYIDILRTKHGTVGDFWSLAADASFKLISTLARNQESASILKLLDWEAYRHEGMATMLNNMRIDGIAITTAGESGLLGDYGAFSLVDMDMGVSLQLFGPSLFVIALERTGGLDISFCYATAAMSEPDAADLADRASAALRNAGQASA
jgi:hypothetical protein